MNPTKWHQLQEWTMTKWCQLQERTCQEQPKTLWGLPRTMKVQEWNSLTLSDSKWMHNMDLEVPDKICVPEKEEIIRLSF
jgi:hypothetical protein